MLPAHSSRPPKSLAQDTHPISQPGRRAAACREGTMCPPCPPVTMVPRPCRTGAGGGWRRCREVPGRLPWAGESRGRRWCCRGGRRAGPQGSARWRKTWQCPWQGTDPTIAAVEPGCPGAHRILTRRPSVSATLTRTAGTGSFRSRFRAEMSWSRSTC